MCTSSGGHRVEWKAQVGNTHFLRADCDYLTNEIVLLHDAKRFAVRGKARRSFGGDRRARDEEFGVELVVKRRLDRKRAARRVIAHELEEESEFAYC